MIPIKFAGDSLPTRVSIYEGAINLNITPYVKAVKQCFNCLQYGHYKQNYRKDTKMCFICGDNYHGNCNKKLQCVNCEGEHGALSRTCIHWALESATNKIMVTTTSNKNLCLLEARQLAKMELRIFDKSRRNDSEIESLRVDDLNFPRLQSKKKNSYREYERWENLPCPINKGKWNRSQEPRQFNIETRNKYEKFNTEEEYHRNRHESFIPLAQAKDDEQDKNLRAKPLQKGRRAITEDDINLWTGSIRRKWKT
ncbi:uncharacterized protein LOC128892960 [Hylaeus anthracinus]|uniref:uncharacterized protein LOC128892960 n=1 Tax=Hylaeus anthracinus TaxID=313031 RepID=UPI0023B971D8|nr:uncharacterized protein LOC128892960 [Hylaeus anthracinus]